MADRVCSDTQYCVIPGMAEVDAAPGGDAAPTDTMPIDADPFVATKAACIAAGYQENATTGSLYRVVTTATTWTNAFNDCNNDVANATHLMSLSNQAEVDYVKTLQDYWIGWIDRPTEGQWHLLTDEVSSINVMTYWGTNRPDGGGAENCAVWHTNVNGIDDVDCPQTHRYICECDGKPVTKPPM